MDIEDMNRQRTALPPIGSLGMDRIKTDDPKQHQMFPSMSDLNISVPPVPSPAQTPQNGPSVPYSSYPPPASNSGPPSSGYISPPDSRRTTKDEGDQSGRQSLPSISEALSDRALGGYPNASAAPEQQMPSASATPLAGSQPRPFLGGPQGPPNPFAQPSSSTPVRSEHPFPPHSTPQGPAQPDSHPSSGFQPVNGTDSRPRPLQTHGLPRSPRTSSNSSFAGGSNRSPTLASGYVSNSATSPTSFGSFRSPFSFNGHPSGQSSTLAPPDESARHFNPNWKFDTAQKYQPPPPPPPPPVEPGHTESVKRQLDIYESEMAFNDVIDGSNRILEFSKHFAQRSFQHQRGELSLEMLPSIPDVEEMMKYAQRLHVGLDRIRGTIICQQQALADQRAYSNKMYEEEMNGYHDEYKGSFGSGDAKKRRGKAAPPGRCHSCNRAETPEWRRGPDGARTLCNACGLHYAKLTRKAGASKSSSLSGSNLRPKNLEMQ